MLLQRGKVCRTTVKCYAELCMAPRAGPQSRRASIVLCKAVHGGAGDPCAAAAGQYAVQGGVVRLALCCCAGAELRGQECRRDIR